MNNNVAKDLYYDMLRIRMVEERIAELYSEQEMRCPVHLSIGQEAPAVGVCSLLNKRYCYECTPSPCSLFSKRWFPKSNDFRIIWKGNGLRHG